MLCKVHCRRLECRIVVWVNILYVLKYMINGLAPIYDLELCGDIRHGWIMILGKPNSP